MPKEASEATAVRRHFAQIASSEVWIRASAVLALTALILGLTWISFLNEQNNDFTEYYCAGQMVRAGIGNRLYDLTAQFDCESKLGPVHVFYFHPAWESLLFLPFTYLSYRTAYFLWTLVSIALLLASAVIIESRLHASAAITEYLRVPSDLGLLFSLFLTFAPVTTCLLLGQDSILMLFIYTVAFVLLEQKRHFLAGCALACGLYKFQVVVPFALILCLRRKWTTVGGFLFGALCLTLVFVALSGTQSLVQYPSFLLNGVSQNIGGFNARATPNIRGLLTVLSRGRLGTVPLTVLVTVTSILVLGETARRWRDDRFRLSFAAAMIASIFASFHIYNYELSLLLLPIAMVCSELTRDRVLRKEKILTVSLITLFIPPLHRMLSLHDAYGLMCVPLLAVFWICLARTRVCEKPSIA